MRKVLEVFRGVRKQEYFCKGGWTPLSTKGPTGKSQTRRSDGPPCGFLSRLLQKLGAQHQAFDLVGAALDFVGAVGEVNVLDHGAALEHCGRALQLQVLDQRDAVALGEQRAV